MFSYLIKQGTVYALKIIQPIPGIEKATTLSFCLRDWRYALPLCPFGTRLATGFSGVPSDYSSQPCGHLRDLLLRLNVSVHLLQSSYGICLLLIVSHFSSPCQRFERAIFIFFSRMGNFSALIHWLFSFLRVIIYIMS